MAGINLILTNWAKDVDTKQLFMFFLIGGLNTLFGYSLYAILLLIGLHYAAASFLGTVGGILFNFKTTGIIVFKNRNNKLLLKFVSVYCITYAVNVGCLRIFAAYGINMYLAGLVLVLPVALLSYMLLKKLVFGGDGRETDKHRNAVFQRGR